MGARMGQRDTSHSDKATRPAAADPGACRLAPWAEAPVSITKPADGLVERSAAALGGTRPSWSADLLTRIDLSAGRAHGQVARKSVCCLRVGLLLAILWLWPLGAAAAQGTGAHRAGVVIVPGQGQATVSACVRFSEDELAGLEVLRRAQAALVTQPSVAGEAVCKIGAIGCDYPAQNCFCQCMSAQCSYWSYWYQENGAWIYSGKGGSNRLVRDGGVDAWVWGDGNTLPPQVTLDALCGMPATALSASGLDILTQPPTPVLASAAQQSYPGPTNAPGESDEYPAPEEDTPTPQPAGSTPNGPFDNLPTLTPRAIPTRDGPTGTPRPSRAPTTPALPVGSPTAKAPTKGKPTAVTAPGAALPTSPFESLAPTGAAGTAPGAQPAAGSAAPGSATPDTVAERIRAAVARLRATPTPAATAERGGKGLWAFGLLVLLLAGAGGYVLLLRRQREQALRQRMEPNIDGISSEKQGNAPPEA